MPFGYRVIQQHRGAIQTIRILQFRPVEAQLRPQFRRGQALARKGIDMRGVVGRVQCHSKRNLRARSRMRVMALAIGPIAKRYALELPVRPHATTAARYLAVACFGL